MLSFHFGLPSESEDSQYGKYRMRRTMRRWGGLILVSGVGLSLFTGLAGLVTASDQTAAEDTDRAALVALYNATDGPNWTNSTNWLSDAPIGEWHGVTTDTSGRAIELTLHNKRLTGEMPAELGDLTKLTRLWLSGNQLTGEIPAELGRLSNLQYLYLYSNQLSGEIPAELDSLSNLERLNLSDNQLSGEIQAALGRLSNLRYLNLAGNELREIPAELGGLSKLHTLNLSGNELTEEIPAALGRLSNLRYLHLSCQRAEGDTRGAGRPVQAAHAVSLRQPVDWGDTGSAGQAVQPEISTPR